MRGSTCWGGRPGQAAWAARCAARAAVTARPAPGAFNTARLTAGVPVGAGSCRGGRQLRGPKQWNSSGAAPPGSRRHVCIVAASPSTDGRPTKQVCRNKRATFDFELLDKYQCGIVLQGTEVKSVRAGKVSLNEAFVRVVNNEVWLIGSNIAVHERANNYDQHDPIRKRKLLLSKKEILKLRQKQDEKGLTLVPTRLFFSGSWLKVEIALARGKKLYDKRESIKQRESKRELGRISKLRY